MHSVNAATRRLVGGALCLDLANSVDWGLDGSERPAHTDVLAAPADLALWGARVGVVDSGIDMQVTGRELAATRELRRAIHDTFAALATGRAPEVAALDSLRRHYGEAVGAGDLRRQERWTFGWQGDEIRRVRFAAAVDAIELLHDPARLARVRICPGRNCGWLFLDTSGRRRWCSMDVCGSRAKMRRLYERKRGRRTRRA
jgi:predicted RNA-binding Zn ribbon-like protein